MSNAVASVIYSNLDELWLSFTPAGLVMLKQLIASLEENPSATQVSAAAAHDETKFILKVTRTCEE